jgi:tetratricopeptide (TPR) repeat protein
MNVDRILGSLREAKDARSIEIGVEAGVIPEELRGTGDFISPETLVRRGVLTPAELARLRRWTEHLERALLVSRRLPSTTPEEVLQRLRVPGALLGKYVLVSPIGSGGMGAVHRAWDTELSRWVALKLLSESEDQESRARFVREARAVAGLDHPGIIPVYEAGQVEGDFYIAMKLIEGSSLRGMRPPAREAARLLRDASRAVHAAHERGLIHRDLKPANLLLESSGRVYVSDFGIAHEIRVDTRLTASGSLLGTPAYMAPEQARGELARIGAPTDVYSLGVTLYELLTGGPPFQDENLYELMKRVVEEDPVRVRTLNPDAGLDLEMIVQRCLEKDPSQRYPSALALAEDLDRYLAGEPVAARGPGLPYHLRKRLGKNPFRTISLIAAIAGLAAAVVYLNARLVFFRAERSAERAAQERHAEQLKAAIQKEALLKQNVAEASELLRRALEQVKDAKALWRVRTSRREQWERLFDSALEITDAAIAKYPELPGGPYTRGEILQARGRWSEAIDSLNRAIELEPQLPEAWYRRGLCHLELYSQALSEQASESSELKASGSEASRRARGAPHKERALADLRRHAVLRGRKDDPESRYAQAAISYIEGRYEEAEQLCDRILAEAQTDEAVWLLRANVQTARKEYAAAVRTVDTLLSSVMPQCAEAYHVRGVARMGLRELVEARDDFAKTLGLDPKATCARVDFGWASGELGDFAGEIDACTKAIETDPRSARAYAQRGWAKGKLDDFRGKVEDCSKAIEIDPGYVDAYNYRAVGLLHLGDARGALEDTTKAIEIDPLHAVAYSNRAMAHLKRSSFKEALADIEKAIELDPRAYNFTTRCSIKVALGDLKGALADGTRAVEMDPGTADHWQNRGKVRACLQDWPGAEKDYDEALRLDPRGSSAWIDRAEARFKLRKFRGAADDATNALELSPGSQEALKVRLAARGEAADWRGMIEDCTRLITLDPASAHAYMNRGAGRARLSEWKAAEEDLSRALELEPGRAGAYSTRAVVRGNLKKWNAALCDAEKAVELEPGSAGNLVNRGWVYGSKGDYQREISDCTRAMALDPASEGAHENRAWARMRSGDYRGAAEDYGWLVVRHPSSGRPLADRGQALLKAGDPRAALADFRQALELSPGLQGEVEPFVADCEKRLGGD